MNEWGNRHLASLQSEKQVLNRSLNTAEIVAVTQRITEIIVKEERAKWEAAHKEKKRGAIDERAQNIFNLYPNRQGGTAALKAISDSIGEDGFDLVLERTTQYAQAVARWPRTYRYSQNGDTKGRDMVPMASTWFNQRRYRDDPTTWARVGNTPPPPQKQIPGEPYHWREALEELYPGNRINAENVSWPEFYRTQENIAAIVLQKLRATA